MTLVEATCCIRRRTVALWVPMANSPSRLAAATLMAPGSESGAPINTTRKKAVRTAHSKPNIHGRGVRPRRSSVTAMTVVIMPATRKIGIANTFVSTSCSCRIAAAARRTRIPDTNEMSALDRIKIDARCRRHVRLRQHALGELEAVVAEARHIGVEVEGPVNRQKFIEPSTRQAFEQNAAILLVAMLDYLHFRAPVECRLGRDLREGRHRDGEIALQPVERAHERFRHDHPADAPASHAEIFRERIDDHAVLG